MKKVLLLTLLMISMLLTCCAQTIENTHSNLLTSKDLMSIVLSHAEGSSSVRTLTLSYMHNGEEECAAIGNVRRIDLEDYDDENGREQTFTVSDYGGDGIFDIIVYREFWFPDLVVSHPDVHEWPTVYEFDLENGFVVASAKHKEYFEKYIEDSKEELYLYKERMSDVAILALNRLIYAAERIADGSFKPESQYISDYYEDVYELTKHIKE